MPTPQPKVQPWPRGRCEYRRLPDDPGFCGKRGRWMVDGLVMCAEHKTLVECSTPTVTSPYFISHKGNGDELWLTARPVNRRIFKFPAGYTPTLEDIDELIYFDGDLPDDADLAEWRASR